MKSHLPIVLTFNEKYARPAYVVMQSIIDTSPAEQQHNFYVLHEGLSEIVKAMGYVLFNTENANIVFLDISKEIKQTRRSAYSSWHVSTFYRLFIPELFKDFDQVLYLDSDVLVVKNIYEICDIVPQEAQLAAVRDASFNPVPKELRIGFWDETPYFNSGVVFFRPSKMTAERRSWCWKLMKRPYSYPDQDILNLVFHDVFVNLSDRWNFLTGYAETQNDGRGDSAEDQEILLARKNERPHVHIFHFICQKPWQVPYIQNAELFRKYDLSLCQKAKAFQAIFQHCLPF